MTAEVPVQRRPNWWFTAIAFALIAFWLSGQMKPLAPWHIVNGLDASWVQASAYALLERLRFGTDFVFTAGPLSPLYTGIYAGEWQWLISLVGVVQTGFLAVCLTKAATSETAVSNWLWPVLTLALALLTLLTLEVRDAALFAIPAFAAILYADRRASLVFVWIGAALGAACVLAKFSVFPVALGCFVLVDALAVLRRRPPLATLILLATIFGQWIAVGQHPAGIIDFLLASMQVAGAYSEAMTLNGPWFDPALWLCTALVLLALFLRQEVDALKASRTDLPSLLCKLAVALGLLAVLVKAGFVRHDQHNIIAWNGLAFLTLILHRPAAAPALNRTLWHGIVFGCCLVPIAVIVLTLNPQRANPMVLTQEAATQVRQAVLLATGPQAWFTSRVDDDARAATAVAAANPLPPIEGSVDIIHSAQSILIANGLNYTPRPTAQEYTTYSPALVARNRAFFEGPAAPDNLVLGLSTIDGRHQASAEGALWPLFLQRYRTTARTADGSLLLERRATPLDDVLSESSRLELSFGANTDLPQSDKPLFIKLDIRKTLAGSLVVQFYRIPLVYLIVGYPGGAEERYRLIPGQIHDGMVISPTVRTPEEYAAIERGETSGLDRPSYFRIEADPLHEWFYEPTIFGSVQEILMPATTP